MTKLSVTGGRYGFALLLLFTAITEATHTGEVVAITDGDTIKILTPAKQQIKVRLADIDTPERGQPYGRKASQVLGDKIHRRQVEVEEVDIDRYKRLVGRVFLDGRNINAEMVEDGAAWVYRKYNRDPKLLELERQAREQGRGLWTLQPDQRVPPWEWRSNGGRCDRGPQEHRSQLLLLALPVLRQTAIDFHDRWPCYGAMHSISAMGILSIR